MNTKGQTNIGIGMLIGTMITILVGAVLILQVAQDVGTSTTSIFLNNSTATAPADGVTIDLTGQDLLDTPIVINTTGGEVPATNYTIDEGVSTTTGVKTIRYTAHGSVYDGESVNLTYTYGPDGYINSAGARSMASLITIFMALLIAVVALMPSIRGKIMDMVR